MLGRGAKRQNLVTHAPEDFTCALSLGANSTIACRIIADKPKWTTQFCILIPFEAVRPRPRVVHYRITFAWKFSLAPVNSRPPLDPLACVTVLELM